METKILYATIVTAILFFVIGAMFGAFYWEHHKPVDLSDTGISDEEYIRIAKQTPEAQKFLEKYPQAEIMVDRSGALAVDFRVEEVDVSGNDNYLRLRVFINPRNHRLTQEKFIDCSGNYTKNNLLEYLRTEKCLRTSYSETTEWETYRNENYWFEVFVYPSYSETTEWETYRNEKYGFEFKYPSIPKEEYEYYKIEGSEEGFTVYMGALNITDLGAHNNRFRIGLSTVVLRIVDLEGITLSEFVNKTIKNLEIKGIEMKGFKIRGKGKILIGGKEGIRVNYTFFYGKGGFGSISFVEKNKKVIIFGFSDVITNIKPPPGYETEVYEAMLSTFRFLE